MNGRSWLDEEPEKGIRFRTSANPKKDMQTEKEKSWP
jgi:hypothetical protein